MLYAVAGGQCCSTKINQQSASVLGSDKLRRCAPGSVGHLTVSSVVFHHQVDIHQRLVSLDNMVEWVVTSLDSLIRKMSDVFSFTSSLPLSQETQ